MATSNITNQITTPTQAGIVVTATLMRGFFRVDTFAEVVGLAATTTDGSGNWDLDLERQSNIAPAASYWIIREFIPSDSGGTREWAILVPDNDSTLFECLTVPLLLPPPSPTPGTDALYVHKAGTEIIPGAKTFTDKTSASNVALRDLGPTFYVDASNGNDSNDGKSAGTPKLTWAAAIAACDNGTVIEGKIIAINRFAITTPIIIGDGTKYVNMVIEGFEAYSGSDTGLGRCRVVQQTANTDAFQFAAGANKTNSLVVRGIEAVGPSAAGTSHGFNFAPAGFGGQWVSPAIHNSQASAFGTGFRIGGSIEFLGESVSAISNGDGFDFVSSHDGNAPNKPILRRFTAQSNVTGIYITAGVTLADFSGIIQSNSDAGIEVFSNLSGKFTLWFEFPGSDMIRLTSQSGGVDALQGCLFESCKFDGSTGAGGRMVFRNNGANNSEVRMSDVTLLNCNFPNLNGGKVVSTANGDPNGSLDPGFINLTIINSPLQGNNLLEGAFAASLQPRKMNWIIGSDVGAGGSAVFTNAAAPCVMQTGEGELRLSNVPLITTASAATRSGINIPHGTAPTSPVNGDVWTTTAGIYVRINGVTVGPLS